MTSKSTQVDTELVDITLPKAYTVQPRIGNAERRQRRRHSSRRKIRRVHSEGLGVQHLSEERLLDYSYDSRNASKSTSYDLLSARDVHSSSRSLAYPSVYQQIHHCHCNVHERTTNSLPRQKRIYNGFTNEPMFESYELSNERLQDYRTEAAYEYLPRSRFEVKQCSDRIFNPGNDRDYRASYVHNMPVNNFERLLSENLGSVDNSYRYGSDNFDRTYMVGSKSETCFDDIYIDELVNRPQSRSSTLSFTDDVKSRRSHNLGGKRVIVQDSDTEPFDLFYDSKKCECDRCGGLQFDDSYYNRDDSVLPPPDVTRPPPRASLHRMAQCQDTSAVVSAIASWPRHPRSSHSSSSSSKTDIAQRHWYAIVTVLLVAGAFGVAVPLALRVFAGASLEERLEMAGTILRDVPLVDGHNDLPWNIRKFLHNKLNDFRFHEDLRNISPWSQSVWSHTDLPRLKRGFVSAQFWAAYVPCDSQHRDAVQLTFEQIDVIRRLTDRYKSQMVFCTSANDIRAAHKEGRLCSMIGVEGGHALGGSLGVLRALHASGARYLTLTSTCHTPWADSALVDVLEVPQDEQAGLTLQGRLIIKEMNRLGMLVDLSHVSTRTMAEALQTSEAPVIFSHSAARALCNTSRNVPDSLLKDLAANRGIIMLNFYSHFLTCSNNASIADAVAHLNHIREVAGVDIIGIGAGFDGINVTPIGLEDVSTYPHLFAELLANGWSLEELRQLAGLNFLRVLDAAEEFRDKQNTQGVQPYEDDYSSYGKRKRLNNCTSTDLF